MPGPSSQSPPPRSASLESPAQRTRLHLVERERATRGAAARDAAKISADQGASTVHSARTKYICTLLVLVQLASAYLLRGAPWWLLVGVAYLFGGVVNQALLLAIHELSHNLGFQKALAKPLVRLVHQLASGRAGRGNLPLLPPLAPRASGPTGNRHGPAYRARGACPERSVRGPAEVAVGDGAGLRLCAAPFVRAPQATIRRGAWEPCAAARVQPSDLTFLGGQGAGLPAPSVR